MKTKNLNIIKTKLPDKGAFTIETQFDFPKMHQLMIVNGKRGAGKSVAITNFLLECKNKHYLDKIYLISPTYNSNKQIWDICDIKPEDVHDVEKGVIKKIIKCVEQDKKEWDEFLYKKELYKKYQQDTRLDRIDDDLLIQYDEYNFFCEKPKWKYPVEQPPRIAVIMDDCLSTDVMARPSEGLLNTCIKHRHIADGLGISLILLTQTYCGQQGISRVIRENVTSLLLFAVHDENQIKKIYTELNLKLQYSKFLEMLEFCHNEPHGFIFIDFSPKDEKYQFRKGWNEVIQLTE